MLLLLLINIVQVTTESGVTIRMGYYNFLCHDICDEPGVDWPPQSGYRTTLAGGSYGQVYRLV